MAVSLPQFLRGATGPGNSRSQVVSNVFSAARAALPGAGPKMPPPKAPTLAIPGAGKGPAGPAAGGTLGNALGAIQTPLNNGATPAASPVQSSLQAAPKALQTVKGAYDMLSMDAFVLAGYSDPIQASMLRLSGLTNKLAQDTDLDWDEKDREENAERHPSELPVKVPLPDVRQHTEYTCGPSALQAANDVFGSPEKEENIAEMAKTDKDHGTTPENLEATALRLGLKMQVVEPMSIEMLKSFLDQGKAVICDIQAWGDEGKEEQQYRDLESGHYVVATGYDDQHIYFEEPAIKGALGELTPQELNARWRDQEDADTGGEKTDHLGIVIWQEGIRPEPKPLPKVEKIAIDVPLVAALSGAGLGGAAGYFITPKHDEANRWRNAIRGAGLGGIGGLMFGAASQADARPSDLPSTRTHETLKDNIKDYYKDAPGGLDAAVDKAQKAMADRPAGGLPDRFQKWDKSELDRTVPIEHARSWPTRELRSMDPGRPASQWQNTKGVTISSYDLFGRDKGSQRIVMSPLGDAKVKEHELTHASIGTMGLPSSTQHKPIKEYDDANPERDLKAESFAGHTMPVKDKLPRSFWNYMSTPVELDPRIAEIKREYVKATGEHVDTKEQAEKALRWSKERATVPYSGEIPTANEIDFHEPDVREAIKQRMTEVVKNLLGAKSPLA